MNFEESLLAIYQLYPNKTGRRKALSEIQKAIERLQRIEEGPMTFDEAVVGMMQAVAVYAKSPAGRCNGLFSGYYPPHPATFFRQSRYLDSPEVWFNVSKPESTAATRQRETSDNLNRAFSEGTAEEVPGNSLSVFQECADRRRRADLARPTQPLLGWGD